ncbi:unnamed protein product [Rotaria magnacalcarata]|uniref:Uncharacterized protein n=1 Tax=Rotaria magnacalcarata TaxID=392030 RepID=A0A8S2KMT9_9BILA|nr:unnamed protein product [Rotaria magnacalcarata]CAF3859688.1 unnamed protein product [Rotaria magnacalcarata]
METFFRSMRRIKKRQLAKDGLHQYKLILQTVSLQSLEDVNIKVIIKNGSKHSISQVYQTIELKRFVDLAPPMNKHRLEKIIVNAAKHTDAQVRIEHKSKALTFGADLNLSSGQFGANDTGLKTNVIQNAK